MEKINFAQLRKYLRDRSHRELVDEIMELIQRFDSVRYHYYSRLFAEEERRALKPMGAIVRLEILRPLGPDQEEAHLEARSDMTENTARQNDARDAEILQMREKGMSNRQIAQAFDLSAQRVGRILLHHERREERRKRLHLIKLEIEQSNSLDKVWPYEELFRILGFPDRAITVLDGHFRAQGIRTMSLKGLLDFLLPLEFPDVDFALLNIPAYKVRGIGYVTFTSLVGVISQIDLGEGFNQEVQRRMEKLIQILKHWGDYDYVIEALESLDRKT
ncbi:MAG: hypothetical protein ACREOO_32095 [bacterium]